jgi:hypothetical protein
MIGAVRALVIATILVLGCGDDASGTGDGGADDIDARTVADAGPGHQAFCPALDAPSGATVLVSPGESIADAVADATAGTTVLVADGVYDISGQAIWFRSPGVTLRSASGNRDDVIIDQGYTTDEFGSSAINVRYDDATIAHLTIRRARYHGVHVGGADDADTRRTRLYDIRVVDAGEQAIKINTGGDGAYYADDGEVACSRLEMTRDGEAFVTSQLSSNSRCYTGGIDAHDAWGWHVRDNWIEGFWCDGSGQEYLAEHGVHFWTGSRDTIVERNRIVNNVRGIGFGLGPGGRTYADGPCGGVPDAGHYGGIIRNNFVTAMDTALFASDLGVQEGISLSAACGASVIHNSVVFGEDALSSIEYRFDQTSGTIANNLVTHRLWDRGGTVTLDTNVEEQTLASYVEPLDYDLHLTAEAAAAIDQGSTAYTSAAPEDVDGTARDSAPDVGADELD